VKRALLLDLDGTITDPKLGITNCLRHALTELGHTAPPADELLWCIGPPLQDSLRKLVGPGDAERALTLYRELYGAVGMYECTLYPGIAEMVTAEAARGRRLYLATSKAHFFAKPILGHFGLERHFTAIYGAELDGTRSDKVDLLRYILATEGLPHGEAIMVGDRSHDIRGARAVGALAVWAGWGYGDAAERDTAGPDHAVSSPAELQSLLAALD
jgi:phosphoglycolate phosphatase